VIEVPLPTDTHLFKYIVEAFDILFEGEDTPTTLNGEQITGMTLEKNYDIDHFPIFKTTLILRPNLYYKILQNKLTVRFRVRMQKYRFQQDGVFLYKTNVINETFCIYLDDNTPFLDRALYDKTSGKGDQQNNVMLQDFSKDYTFFLFKEKDVNDSKAITNKVISKATLTDAIAYLFSVNGFKKVLMTPLENKKIYDEIVFQPVTLIGNLNYIEQQFGLYKSGTVLFFDFDVIYLIHKTSKCTAWRANENKQTVFTVRSSLNPDNLSPGSYEDIIAKKYYINIGPNSFQMANATILNDHVDGNNLIVINPITAGVTKIEPKSVQRGSGTYKVVTNKYNNTTMNDVETANRNEPSKIITVNIGDFDIDAITPNKEFMFIFEDKNMNLELGGNYRLSSSIIEFVKQGADFHITGSCQLRKQTF
jgi:hypothetical protein